MIASLLLAALALAPSATAATPPAAAAQSEQAALAAIAARGRLLYDYDQAAWHTTDALVAALPDPGAAGVRGWIVEPQGGALRVTFYGRTADAAVPIYVAGYGGGKVTGGRVVPPAERTPLGAVQMRMIRAGDALAGQKLARCTDKPFNRVVVAPAGPDAPIDVYILTPQPGTTQYPMGGHYRFTVDAGGRVQSNRKFMTSCFTMDTANVPTGGKAVGFVITHLLDPTPTEIHVFTSLASGTPLFVATPDKRLWSVQGDRIRLVTTMR